LHRTRFPFSFSPFPPFLKSRTYNGLAFFSRITSILNDDDKYALFFSPTMLGASYFPFLPHEEKLAFFFGLAPSFHIRDPVLFSFLRGLSSQNSPFVARRQSFFSILSWNEGSFPLPGNVPYFLFFFLSDETGLVVPLSCSLTTIFLANPCPPLPLL